MSILVQEKVQQAVEILNELEIDAWMTFVRETPAGGDPVLPLIYGHDLTAQTAMILSRSGERIVILGQFEAETARRTGAYPSVISYNQSIRPALLETLEKINPAQIAINYSKSDVLADGLDHGLYLTLLDILEGTPWQSRLVSAEKVIGALRGRKTEEEIKRIRAAVETTRQIFVRTFDHVQPGMTEKQIAKLMHTQLRDFRVTAAWEYQNCPAVNAGPDSPSRARRSQRSAAPAWSHPAYRFRCASGPLLLRYPTCGILPQTRRDPTSRCGQTRLLDCGARHSGGSEQP